jgi:hypothetical protein
MFSYDELETYDGEITLGNAMLKHPIDRFPAGSHFSAVTLDLRRSLLILSRCNELLDGEDMSPLAAYKVSLTIVQEVPIGELQEKEMY